MKVASAGIETGESAEATQAAEAANQKLLEGVSPAREAAERPGPGHDSADPGPSTNPNAPWRCFVTICHHLGVASQFILNQPLHIQGAT
jgi:hypothetical protein